MGKRHVLGGGLLVAATALAAYLALAPERAPNTLYSDFSDWLGESLTRDSSLDERIQALQRFMAVHDDLVNEFLDGRSSFADAVDRILAASREQCPQFLDNVARSEDGDSPAERVARNLVRHAEKHQQFLERPQARERLHAELADYLKKVQRGPMAAPAGAA